MNLNLHTIPEVEHAKEYRDYWIKGFLQIAEEEQRFFYVGCSNCSSKINTAQGTLYECLMCKQEVVSTLRPIVAVSITDRINTLKAIAVESVAKRILQSTAPDIARMSELKQGIPPATHQHHLQQNQQPKESQLSSPYQQQMKKLKLKTMANAEQHFQL